MAISVEELFRIMTIEEDLQSRHWRNVTIEELLNISVIEDKPEEASPKADNKKEDDKEESSHSDDKTSKRFYDKDLDRWQSNLEQKFQNTKAEFNAIMRAQAMAVADKKGKTKAKGLRYNVLQSQACQDVKNRMEDLAYQFNRWDYSEGNDLEFDVNDVKIFGRDL